MIRTLTRTVSKNSTTQRDVTLPRRTTLVLVDDSG